MHAGIVGAGLLGRLLAWRLLRQGWKISLFDQRDQSVSGSASSAAGGMLALITEQEAPNPIIYQLGKQSLTLWPQWLSQLQQPVFFQKNGSILLAHRSDYSQLKFIAQRLQRAINTEVINLLTQAELNQLEPELNFSQGYYLKEEAQIDGRELLQVLFNELKNENAKFYFNCKVNNVSPNLIITNQKKLKFDWVFDCRGIGARDQFSELRAVRGELIYLQAPEVNLSHVIRFFHPRYRLYIIPRPKNIYLLGATEIESCDESSISVRSCLELLSAAYSVHKGFAEARMIETITALRPAFTDNLPRFYYKSGLISINGLYRHGYLIAPAIVEEIIRLTKKGLQDFSYLKLMHEVSDD